MHFQSPPKAGKKQEKPKKKEQEDEIIKFYDLLGLSWDYVDTNRFMELFNADLFDLINGNKDFEYSSIYKTTAENLIAGLLLGYPLESTVDIIY